MSPADLPVPSTLLEFHMSHTLDIDPRRTYVPRHGKPEQLPEPVTPPAWAPDERARPIRVPGEETVKMPFSEPVGDELTGLRLPSRAHGAALEALMMPVPRPKPSLLGQCLLALRSWWSQ